MTIPHRVKVLDICRVGPPPGSVAEASLPLTFFDVIWLQAPSVQQIFFYQLTESNTTAHVINSLLPNLKRSLSLALRVFFPLAGSLKLSRESGELEIRYIDGDSVQLTVAESDSDFRSLAEDRPKEMALLQHLVPDVPTSDSDLLSVQLTVFPNSGVCIGISVHHVAADGSSTMQFVKHWASISRLGADSVESHPVYDRALVPDPHRLKRTFLEHIKDRRLGKECWGPRARTDTVAATFVLSRARIERLRQRVAMARPSVNGEKPKLPRYSPFTLACAHVWVCLARARGDESTQTAHFKYDSGCRARFHPPIPDAYFGNCIRPCFVRAGKADIAGESGIWVACEAIWRMIQGLNDSVDDDDVLKGAVGWVPRLVSISDAEERLIWVSWSPKIGVYDTDFGMGKPWKVEVISIEGTGAMSLTEGRDGEGLEVGLALPRWEMESFASLFEDLI